MYVLSLIIFTILMSVIDFYTNKYYINVIDKITFYEKLKLISLLIIHNVIYFTLYFSIFFIIYNYKTINPNYIIGYAFYLFITMVHWKTNNNRCKFTEMTNEILGIDKSIGFRDPYAILFNIQYKKAGSGTLRDKLYNVFIILSFGLSFILYLNKISFVFNKKKTKK